MLGHTLWEDDDSKDFQLVFHDGFKYSTIFVHKFVLRACSSFFYEHLGGKHSFFYIWNINENTIDIAKDVIKYMYIGDFEKLRNRNWKELETFALKLNLPFLYNLVEERQHQKQTQPRSQKKQYRRTYNTRSSKRKLRRRH